MARYTYRPLEKGKEEIRLLAYRGESAISGTTLLKFDVSHCSLASEDVPEYSAISYAWDAVPAWKPIVLDGQVVQVSSSAVDTLHGLCNGMKANGWSVEWNYWIDAICINQSNLEEKTWQVAMMGTVYTRALCTHIWLGDDDGTAQSAKRTLKLLFDECMEHLGDNLEMLVFAAANEERPYTGLAFPSECDWPALYSLLDRRWFTRLWVIQEIALADSVGMFCGSCNILWYDFSYAVRWLAHRIGTWHEDEHNMHRLQEQRYRRLVKFADIQIQTREGAITMDNLLGMNRYANATNPWDRVFALTGLITDPALTVTPDYGRPLREVYADASYNAMLSTKRLGLMVEASVGASGLGAITEDWPSWTIQLDTTKGEDLYTLYPVSSRGSLFDAATECSLQRVSPQVIRVRGVNLGKVMKIMLGQFIWQFRDCSGENRFKRVVVGLEFVKPRLAALWSPHFLMSHQQWSKDVFEGLTKAMLEGRGNAYVHPFDALPVLPLADFAALVLDLADDAQRAANPALVQTLHDSGAEFGNPVSPEVRGLFAVESSIFAKETTVVGLADGSFARCFGHVAPGDHIWHIFGAYIAIVLRQKGHEWRICGAARLPGTSNGEHIEKLRAAGQLESRTQCIDIA